MQLPREVPVMTLPEGTLLPQAMLPLFIYEPRYRQMLADALHTHRMFTVAMQRPHTTRGTPLPMAGLGLIRVSVAHHDGTSHLILQGLTRVALEETVRVKPYRVARVRPIPTPPCDSVVVDALLAKVRELLREWLELGPTFPTAFATASKVQLPKVVPDDVLGYLNTITNAEQAVDLISCAVLREAADRQAIIEAVDMETRLRRLTQCLLAEIRRQRTAE